MRVRGVRRVFGECPARGPYGRQVVIMGRRAPNDHWSVLWSGPLVVRERSMQRSDCVRAPGLQ